MTSSVIVVAAALLVANPSLGEARASLYARHFVDAAGPDIDPLTLVAIAWHESRVRNVASADGEDFGLCQVRARHSRACRKGTADECEREKRRLLTPRYNLRRAAQIIRAWRALCRKRTGKPALLRRWLHGYGGFGRPPALICGQRRARGRWRDVKTPKRIARIVRFREKLVKTKRLGRLNRGKSRRKR